MVTAILIFWFVLAFLSLIYITYDLIFVTPEASVMKAGWWLVTLYAGPIGLFFYLISCKEPMPGTHEAFIKPLWKQALGSEVHCLAGDVTGIVVAAIIISFFEISMGLEIFIEYLAGFFFGLLIFQSLFMKNMMGGTYSRALKVSFYPEFVSMNMIMAGMIPTMVIWSVINPEALSPRSMHFWGKMSLATIIGGITAYAANRWLVKTGLKHGMMTMGKEGKMVSHPIPHEEMSHHDREHHHSATATRRQMVRQLIISLVGLSIGIFIGWGFWALASL